MATVAETDGLATAADTGPPSSSTIVTLRAPAAGLSGHGHGRRTALLNGGGGGGAIDSDAGEMSNVDMDPDGDADADAARVPGTSSLAPAPLTRGRKPKGNNVKFSPRKTTARRAAAAAAAGNLANSAGKSAAQTALEEPNNDYCDACGGKGHFLCCDGCPRSFHFSCLNPPLELDTIPADAWYCRVCETSRKPPAPVKGVFGPLISKVTAENPSIFKLPREIKSSFRNITTGTYGEYVNTNEFRPLSTLARTGKGGIGGAYEDRDPFKQKDKSGRTVLCHRCKEAASQQRQRRIVGCDFCELHWHLDCLDPPLVGMPPLTRKWKCPMHADSVMPADKKLKHQRLIRVKEPRTKNNGDIDIIPAPGRIFGAAAQKPEELISQGLRYQVPEQIVIIDFWTKIRRDKYGRPLASSNRQPSPNSITTFDFSDSSSLTSMEPSPEREMGPVSSSTSAALQGSRTGAASASSSATGHIEPGIEAIIAASGSLDRLANGSQQRSQREGTEISDGDPPEFLAGSSSHNNRDDLRDWSEPTSNNDDRPVDSDGHTDAADIIADLKEGGRLDSAMDISLTAASDEAADDDNISSKGREAATASASRAQSSRSTPAAPELSADFQNRLSAAGLGPASKARSVSPHHPPITSTPPKRSTSSSGTNGVSANFSSSGIKSASGTTSPQPQSAAAAGMGVSASSVSVGVSSALSKSKSGGSTAQSASPMPKTEAAEDDDGDVAME